MKENHIEKLNLKTGDLVVYEANEDIGFIGSHFYMMQGLKKDNWLANFDGTVRVHKRFSELNIPVDITEKNYNKLLNRINP